MAELHVDGIRVKLALLLCSKSVVGTFKLCFQVIWSQASANQILSLSDFQVHMLINWAIYSNSIARTIRPHIELLRSASENRTF